jgi:hypothetical protein
MKTVRQKKEELGHSEFIKLMRRGNHYMLRGYMIKYI